MTESASYFYYFTKATFCCFYKFTEINQFSTEFKMFHYQEAIICCLENKSSAVVLCTPNYTY